MNIVFYHDDRQKEAALGTKERVQKARGRPVETVLRPFKKFYRAEDYHQKYLMGRNSEIVSHYRKIYPNFDDFVDSTAVTRLNGYLGGHGKLQDLEKEVDDLGLPQHVRNDLVARFKRRARR